MFDDLIGKPYADGGRGPAEFDCYGLVLECARRMGQSLPPYPTKSQAAGQRDTLFSAMESGDWHEVSGDSQGSVALFRLGEFQWHVGFVLPGEWFIHVIEGQAVVKQRLAHPFWCNKLKGFWRYEGSFPR